VVSQATQPVERVLDGFSHEVAFYRGSTGLAGAVLPFIRDGVARREPVLVALVPDKLALVERALGADATRVDFVDMSELGANPACIIPEWRRFLEDTQDSGPVRGVGEPVWSGRREVEVEEAELHEALLNLAFDDGPGWRLLCPYDVTGLPPGVVEEAMRSHPLVHSATGRRVGYAGHEHAASAFAAPLPDAPAHAGLMHFAGDDLARVRRMVRGVASSEGLGRAATDELTLAVHELAANSVLHGGGHGTVQAWREPDALVVEVRDPGRIDDPLVGRDLIDVDAENGRGIWMANQLCDLVQVRSGPEGTQVRLRVWL
jgi:anti-sigma regulatory factor (Ser/Thr protein kinase)